MGSERYGLTATRKSPEYVCSPHSASVRPFHSSRGTHVDFPPLIPDPQVVHDRRLVQVGQVGNVFGAVKVGWVDAREEVGFDAAHL